MKTRRQLKIVELVKDFDIETQEELVSVLRSEGFNVTQATISRDIRDLKLTKVSLPDGRQKYDIFTKEDFEVSRKLKRVFREGVISIDYAQNILVIKTLVGMAMAVAAAIDDMNNEEILGTIAGDDNIFCVVKTEEKAIKLMDMLKSRIEY